MSSKVNILSTRVLSKELTASFNEQITLLQQQFIEFKPISFKKSELLTDKYWIITSQQTLNIIFQTYSLSELKKINFYVVGLQTAKKLNDNQLKVIEWANYAQNLALKIIKNHSEKHFFFIGGEIRRDELPSLLKNHNVSIKMIDIYTTVLSPYEINEPKLDGLIFFSPSAVQSYVIKNTISNEQVFCIGNTTAQELKKYSSQIHVPKEQTFKSVIDLVNTYYNE
ncbi:MAG TPA: uroporphyrinogen-III synthase [Crocinitomix sp.]|nr:uroporphyrinogen-III synthase [Crocinitomix sp.]